MLPSPTSVNQNAPAESVSGTGAPHPTTRGSRMPGLGFSGGRGGRCCRCFALDKTPRDRADPLNSRGQRRAGDIRQVRAAPWALQALPKRRPPPVGGGHTAGSQSRAQGPGSWYEAWGEARSSEKWVPPVLSSRGTEGPRQGDPRPCAPGQPRSGPRGTNCQAAAWAVGVGPGCGLSPSGSPDPSGPRPEAAPLLASPAAPGVRSPQSDSRQPSSPHAAPPKRCPRTPPPSSPSRLGPGVPPAARPLTAPVSAAGPPPAPTPASGRAGGAPARYARGKARAALTPPRPQGCPPAHSSPATGQAR